MCYTSSFSFFHFDIFLLVVFLILLMIFVSWLVFVANYPYFFNHKKVLPVFMKMYFQVHSDYTINIFITLLSMKHNYKTKHNYITES